MFLHRIFKGSFYFQPPNPEAPGNSHDLGFSGFVFELDNFLLAPTSPLSPQEVLFRLFPSCDSVPIHRLFCLHQCHWNRAWCGLCSCAPCSFVFMLLYSSTFIWVGFLENFRSMFVLFSLINKKWINYKGSIWEESMTLLANNKSRLFSVLYKGEVLINQGKHDGLLSSKRIKWRVVVLMYDLGL